MRTKWFTRLSIKSWIKLAGRKLWRLAVSPKAAVVATAWIALVAILFNNRHHDQSLAKQSEAIDQQWTQFAKGVEQDRQQRADDRRDRDAQERKSQAPFLAIVQCCNPRPIEMGEFVEFAANKHSGKKALLLKEDVRRLEPGEMPTKGFVAAVENIGGGPAMDCRIEWQVDKALLADGSQLPAESLGHPPYNNCFLAPRVIRPGANGLFSSIPGCLSEDGEQKIVWIEGSVTLRCLDLFETEHAFSQRFTIAPANGLPGTMVCVPRNADPTDTAWLLFHFNELGEHDGPFPHHIAKAVDPLHAGTSNLQSQERSTLKPAIPELR